MLCGEWTPNSTFWAVALCYLALAACSAAAQQKVTGYDAVYNSSGNPTSSPAFLDASMFGGATFCSAIYNVLTKTTSPHRLCWKLSRRLSAP